MIKILLLIIGLFSNELFAEPVSLDNLKQNIDSYRNSTKEGKLNVAFSIDNVALFSSACIYDYVRTKCEGNFDLCATKPDFWEFANNEAVKCSVPKEIMLKLLAIHEKDSIYFVTNRKNSKSELLTDFMMTTFNKGKVIFTNDTAKTLKENNIKVFYSDLDSDMVAIQSISYKGDTIAVRILRSPNAVGSINEYNPYSKCEKVLIDSEY